MDPEAPNILHTLSERASWSRANEKGVFPGVATPLNWSIWGEIGERAVRRAGFELGLFEEHELEPPESADDRSWSIFYGRPTANVDTWRRLHVGLTASESAQAQAFGDATSSAVVDHGSDRRRQIAERRAAALPRAADGMRQARREVERWWSEATRPESLADPEACRAVFAQGLDWFERADRFHILVSLLSMEAIIDLSTAAERAGLPGAANEMMIGYPGMEEFETTAALWAVSRDEQSLQSFLSSHGFHGAQEGEIASHSWREDPEPVASLAARYRGLDEREDPRLREAAAIARRAELEAALRDATAAAERDALDDSFERAATFLPLREAGRASLTIALDAMRAAARAVADDLTARGALANAGDVFLLSRDELLDPPADLPSRVEERRALRTFYASFELPETWHGMPEKRPPERPAATLSEAAAEGFDRGERLEGLAASAGRHEGTARLVLDPSRLGEEFEAGDVLIAPATDPSWAPFFLVAGAVVIDTGSNFSHAAVVAREMGIPAVVSVADASRRIPDGARIRVDGSAGTVERLA